eukprot:840684-Pleurochrysis_carterae.AAC.1
MSTASTRQVSARSVQPAFSAVPSRAYTRSDWGEAHRQMSCMFSSGHPAARRAQASPTRRECQGMPGNARSRHFLCNAGHAPLSHFGSALLACIRPLS